MNATIFFLENLFRVLSIRTGFDNQKHIPDHKLLYNLAPESSFRKFDAFRLIEFLQRFWKLLKMIMFRNLLHNFRKENCTFWV